MRGRTLTAEEARLWARVMDSVRPMRGARDALPASTAPPASKPPAKAQPVAKPPVVGASAPMARMPAAPPPHARGTLDGRWDRQIGRGQVVPDSTIDLHGHGLSSAWHLLDQGLDRAIVRGDRVMLLVTGKPPRAENERPHARGAIRASIADWLAASRHAGRIAAVRGAHPRHGGSGALYIVLRRPRERQAQD